MTLVDGGWEGGEKVPPGAVGRREMADLVTAVVLIGIGILIVIGISAYRNGLGPRGRP